MRIRLRATTLSVPGGYNQGIPCCGNIPMILDCLEPIELTDEATASYKNHLSSLRRLSTGLRFLYSQVKRAETTFREQFPKEVEVCWFGRLPGIPIEQHDLLECSFQWYAVSVCSFTRMMGWLRYSDKQSEPSLKAYIEKVLPGPLGFRDKVGAHLAASCFKDNLAEKLASLIPQVSWSDTRFYGSAMTVGIKGGNEAKGRDSRKIRPWSLTEEHEKLMARYPLLISP
jgi:hypothetical protein